MQVRDLTIAFRAGANGAPQSGLVEFSDGRAYQWFALIEYDPFAKVFRHMGQYRFGGHRSVANGYATQAFTFASRPREVALIEALNGN